jgi:hypothetical protein
MMTEMAEAIGEAATRPTMAGGGLDRPYREMSSSGPDVDRFLPEQ